ncbi:MAG: hypothetical protein U0235_05545 [Polyangiaceae bacterium]
MTSRACLFSWFLGFACVSATALSAPPARAEALSDVEVVASQFADKVDSGAVVGDGKSSPVVTYVVWAKSGGPSEVVLVWSADGKERARQTLEVGRSPKWRTWGMAPAGSAKSIEVRVLDAAGRELKKDVLERG